MSPKLKLSFMESLWVWKFHSLYHNRTDAMKVAWYARCRKVRTQYLNSLPSYKLNIKFLGNNYEYSATLPILKAYPKVVVEVKWQLKDGNGQDIVCVKIPAKIE